MLVIELGLQFESMLMSNVNRFYKMPGRGICYGYSLVYTQQLTRASVAGRDSTFPFEKNCQCPRTMPDTLKPTLSFTLESYFNCAII